VTAPLLDEFLAEECTPHVVGVLRDAVRARSGKRYFTFNRFNVRLDLDGGTATIEDELDPDVELTLALDEFMQHVEGTDG
jgi:hypothetical protein